MFSQDFMRFLINYQTPEYKKDVNKEVRYLGFGTKRAKLASVLLTVRK